MTEKNKRFIEVNAVSMLIAFFILGFLIKINFILGLIISILIHIVSISIGYKKYKYSKELLEICLIQTFTFFGVLMWIYDITGENSIVYVMIGVNILGVFILYLLFREKVRHWFIYLGIFVGSVFLVTFSFIFSIIIVQMVFEIRDEYIITIIYCIAVLIPVIFIIFEKDEKQLNEIKVAIYAWIALSTTVGSISFLYQVKIEEYIYENILEINVNLDDLEKTLLDPNGLKNFEERLEELHVIYKFNGEPLEPNVIVENVKKKVTEPISEIVDLIIKILFLPHILGGAIGAFFIEWKEKRKKYKVNI